MKLASLTVLTTASLVVSSMIAATGAYAAGALAIGYPENVSQSGFAYGFSYNNKSASEARDAALEACRTTQAAPPSAKSLCTVIGTFHGECVAIAMDPKAGTPGVGFAIAADKDTAEARALAFCAATAGKDRKDFCVLDKSACDK
jgi:hypothetical protein